MDMVLLKTAIIVAAPGQPADLLDASMGHGLR